MNEVFYLLVNLVMYCCLVDGLAGGETPVADWQLFFPGLFASLDASVMIFLVGASTFENNVAWNAIVDGKAELGLVEGVFLGLSHGNRRKVRACGILILTLKFT